MATQVPGGTGVPAVTVPGQDSTRWAQLGSGSIPVRHLWKGERPQGNLPQMCCLPRRRVLLPRTLVRRYS